MNESNGLYKLCECDSEDLMHVLCDYEPLKCVIDLINLNNNNIRDKCVKNDFCLDVRMNLIMNRNKL